jgi:hypothetical protein
MATTGGKDPRKTIIVVSDDGKIYRLTDDQWETQANLVTDAGGKGVIQELTRYGSYLSYVPPKIAVGFGEICIVLNVGAVLKNNPR